MPPSDSKLAAVVGRRESLGQRAREKGLGKHPVLYEREEETGVPLRDATCSELKVRAGGKQKCNPNIGAVYTESLTPYSSLMLSSFCSTKRKRVVYFSERHLFPNLAGVYILRTH